MMVCTIERSNFTDTVASADPGYKFSQDVKFFVGVGMFT